MTAITVRQLPVEVKHRLQVRAAANGRSMEAEARSILTAAVSAERPVDLSWVERLVAIGDEAGGVDLPVVPDTPARAAHFPE